METWRELSQRHVEEKIALVVGAAKRTGSIGAAARELGMPRRTAQRILSENGVDSTPYRGTTPSHIDPAINTRRYAMHGIGMSASQMAAAEGISVGCMYEWARRRGLTFGRAMTDQEARRVEMFEAGVPVDEIAAEQGVTPAAIYQWSRRRKAAASVVNPRAAMAIRAEGEDEA